MGEAADMDGYEQGFLIGQLDEIFTDYDEELYKDLIATLRVAHKDFIEDDGMRRAVHKFIKELIVLAEQEAARAPVKADVIDAFVAAVGAACMVGLSVGTRRGARQAKGKE